MWSLASIEVRRCPPLGSRRRLVSVRRRGPSGRLIYCALRSPAKRPEGFGRSTPHVRVAVFERDLEGLGRARVTDPAQSFGGSATDTPARVNEAGDEWGPGGRVTGRA